MFNLCFQLDWIQNYLRILRHISECVYEVHINRENIIYLEFLNIGDIIHWTGGFSGMREEKRKSELSWPVFISFPFPDLEVSSLLPSRQ